MFHIFPIISVLIYFIYFLGGGLCFVNKKKRYHLEQSKIRQTIQIQCLRWWLQQNTAFLPSNPRSLFSWVQTELSCSWFQSISERKQLRPIPGPSLGPGLSPSHSQSHQERNCYAGRIHLLPDLIQQSHHSPSTSPSSSHASPSMSPQIPMDMLIVSEVCPLPLALNSAAVFMWALLFWLLQTKPLFFWGLGSVWSPFPTKRKKSQAMGLFIARAKLISVRLKEQLFIQ